MLGAFVRLHPVGKSCGYTAVTLLEMIHFGE